MFIRVKKYYYFWLLQTCMILYIILIKIERGIVPVNSEQFLTIKDYSLSQSLCAFTRGSHAKHIVKKRILCILQSLYIQICRIFQISQYLWFKIESFCRLNPNQLIKHTTVKDVSNKSSSVYSSQTSLTLLHLNTYKPPHIPIIIYDIIDIY